MKDWRRATKLDQHVPENLPNTDTTGFPQENPDSIYEGEK